MHALLLLMTMLAPDPPQREAQIQALLVEIDQSGRVMDICEIRAKVEDPRKQIAPGQPPLLSFRYFQGADRHRFGKLDLMLDDAGH
jgi:hypothetical protein